MDNKMREYIEEQASGLLFEDMAGRDYWKKLLGSYICEPGLDAALLMESAQCFLLYGPLGCGKNTLIQAMAGEMQQAGYKYLELDMEKVPENKQAELFEFICREYFSDTPCFLILNHIEKVKAVVALWKLVNDAEEKEMPLIVAAAAEEEAQLIPEVRKLFQAYYIGLPDENDRKSYLEMTVENLFSKSSMQSMKLLLEGTEGYDYLQMEALVRQIKLRVKHQILNHEKDEITAMSWLDADLVKEVLVHTAPVKKKKADPMEELLAAIQAIAAMQPAQMPAQTLPNMGTQNRAYGSPLQATSIQNSARQEQAAQKTPLDDLRSRLDPHRVFDKGVMFAKKEN